MTLTAGPELDAAVAEACGIEGSHDYECVYGENGHSDYQCTNCGDEIGHTPDRRDYRTPCVKPYSTDLNAAFEAASACPGVDGIHVERTKTLEWYANIGGSIAYAETPAMAICNAILALTARPSSSGSPSS